LNPHQPWQVWILLLKLMVSSTAIWSTEALDRTDISEFENHHAQMEGCVRCVVDPRLTDLTVFVCQLYQTAIARTFPVTHTVFSAGATQLCSRLPTPISAGFPTVASRFSNKNRCYSIKSGFILRQRSLIRQLYSSVECLLVAKASKNPRA